MIKNKDKQAPLEHDTHQRELNLPLKTPRHTIYVGLDTGTQTGFAIWNKDLKTLSTDTVPIHVAMERIKSMHDNYLDNLFVRFEDARLRVWFGNAGREKLQGAGSIKRDCTIWEDFLKSLGVSYEAVAPRHNQTKLSAKQFNQITKYIGSTNEHSRDAAMLVYGL